LTRRLSAPGLILDAGAAEGALAYKLSRTNHTVVCLDIDINRLKKAPKPALCADIQHPLPFKDNIFCAALLVEVLEHCLNPFAVLQEIQRVLLPGGLVLVTVPNVLSLTSRLRFLLTGWFNLYSPKRLNAPPQHRHIFPLPAPVLLLLLEKAGFLILDVCTDRLQRTSLALLPLLLPATAATKLPLLLGRTLIALAQKPE